MGRVLMTPMGAVSSSDDCTAVAGDVIKGKTAIVNGSNDEPIAGTLELTGNTEAANVLTGKTFYKTDPKTKITGTMANRGAVSQSLNAGGSYTIPAGYHNGSGKVTANSLSSQTSGTATADQILSGKVAWVNGAKVTGTMVDRTNVLDSTLGGINSAYPNVAIYKCNGNPQIGTTTKSKEALFALQPQPGWYSYSYVGATLAQVRTTIGYTDSSKVLTGTTIAGLAGTMPNLTNETTITHETINGTKVILGDACWYVNNSDGVWRLDIRYAGKNGYITQNTLFAIDGVKLRAAIGYTNQNHVLSGVTIAGAPGTMPYRGNVSQTLNAGASYTIPQGYHEGGGKVTANSLSSQTSATATAAQILSGQTAWVNGSKITGSMTNRGNVSATVGAGDTYTIPQGYHAGGGRVTGGQSTVAGIAAVAYSSTSGDDGPYSESFTMPRNGRVYYGGTARCSSTRTRATCAIYKNGTVVDNRNLDGNYFVRGSMINKAFNAAKGDVIKVESAITTRGDAYTIVTMQAFCVYP